MVMIMAVNAKDMVAILQSGLSTAGALVEKIRQRHEDIGNAFDGESSSADSVSADAADASDATAGAKEVLAADTETRDAQQEVTDTAQENFDNSTTAYNETLDPLQSAKEALAAAFAIFASLLGSDDKDAIGAAAADVSARQGEADAAQQATDSAEQTMNQDEDTYNHENTQLETDNTQVDTDEAAVEEAEADEAEVASEAEAINGEVEETEQEAESAAQQDQADNSGNENDLYSDDNSNYNWYSGDDNSDYGDDYSEYQTSAPSSELPEEIMLGEDPFDPFAKTEHEFKRAEFKIQNNEITDSIMAEVITEDIFAGDVANTSLDELVGLNAQDAIAKVNENLKAQSLYTNNVSTTMDTASVDENQEAISDFYGAYLDVQDKLAQTGVEFLTATDEVNYATLAGVAEKLNASEYVMTAEIKKATSTADSIQVTTSDVTDVENKEAEIKGATLLKELEAVITDDADAKEDENDDVLTQKEYDNKKNFFENAQNKADAYDNLAKDAEKYNIFALAA